MPIQDDTELENILDEAADCFEDKMKQLFDEVPEVFSHKEGGQILVHSTQATWNAQVSFAGDEFRKELNKFVEKFEIRLLQGEFA